LTAATNSSGREPLFLVISQVYVPDAASVGQHMADAAEAMARRGYRVRVLTSRNGYDDPRERYPAREQRNGVEIVRLPFSSFGKRTLAHRIVGQGLFLLQVVLHGIFTRGLCKILITTSPPMASFAALAIKVVRRVPISYWVMDLNPDQAIALGKVRPNGVAVRALRWLNARIFANAAEVIVLDRFMAERIQKQYTVEGQLEILPPWPHDEHLEPHGDKNPFRETHNPEGRFVVMYSGNHSIASPLATLIEAARRLQDDRRFLFMFVGGGQGKRAIDDAIATHGATNVLSLPYQPLNQLCYSLSTADIHVVTLGDDMVGIIHPCKIYGALAVGRPVLFLGPQPSHATDLIERFDVGWHMRQGDVESLVEKLQSAVELHDSDRAAIGQRAQAAIAKNYSKAILCEAFCDVIDPKSADYTSAVSHGAGEFAA
jgi:colanic acid biosynthesis glycosyl transferase WcaI